MRGIAILGLNGSGKSTLAHVLAKQINYFEIDVEDYYFPEQRKSRRWSLDYDSIVETDHLGPLPFSKPRVKEEVESMIALSIKNHPNFILSSVAMNWQNELLSRLDIAFWVITPLAERLRRIQAREEKRFGSRVLKGGDMYLQQQEFKKFAEQRTLSLVEASVAKLDCPVIKLDGTLSVAENIEIIKDYLTTPASVKVWRLS